MQNVVLELRAKLKAETRVILMVQLLNYHQRSQMLGLSTHVLLMVLDCYYTKTKDSQTNSCHWTGKLNLYCFRKSNIQKWLMTPSPSINWWNEHATRQCLLSGCSALRIRAKNANILKTIRLKYWYLKPWTLKGTIETLNLNQTVNWQKLKSESLNLQGKTE